MALTVKLVSREGDLVILDDEFGKIGTGEAKPSSKAGYITLKLKFTNPHLKKGKLYVDDFLVIRVPISWLEM